MPAHVKYPKLDSRPAGFSQIWLQDVLRAKLGFGGAVFSDDLSMAAARVINGRALSYTEAALAALGAGCDMVLLCNQSLAHAGAGRPIDDVIDGLAQAHIEHRWTMDECSEERRLALLPKLAGHDWADLVRSSDYMQALDWLP
jgi:beta-N-acetylhexosaminidase